MSAQYFFHHDQTNQKTVVTGNHGKKYAKAKAAVQMHLQAAQVDSIGGGRMEGKVRRNKSRHSRAKSYERARRSGIQDNISSRSSSLFDRYHGTW